MMPYPALSIKRLRGEPQPRPGLPGLLLSIEQDDVGRGAGVDDVASGERQKPAPKSFRLSILRRVRRGGGEPPPPGPPREPASRISVSAELASQTCVGRMPAAPAPVSRCA